MQRPLRSRLALVVALACALLVPAAARAADTTGIGYVDQAALSALPAFAAVKRSFDAYGADLQKTYLARARNASTAEQQRLAQEFQAKMADKQRSLFGPLFGRAQIAIASVASSKNLSIVVDKQIMIVGGTDITNDVRELLAGPGDPVPPVSGPPPSTVGYVDQTAIDAVPAIKSAADEYAKFKAAEDQQTAVRFKAAKTQADKDAVLKEYQKALLDKQNQTLKPLVDKTTAAMADVAHKRGLVLVIDRTNVIYGGTDITADVTSALK
jgi:outer membrane protein